MLSQPSSIWEEVRGPEGKWTASGAVCPWKSGRLLRQGGSVVGAFGTATLWVCSQSHCQDMI